MLAWIGLLSSLMFTWYRLFLAQWHKFLIFYVSLYWRACLVYLFHAISFAQYLVRELSNEFQVNSEDRLNFIGGLVHLWLLYRQVPHLCYCVLLKPFLLIGIDLQQPIAWPQCWIWCTCAHACLFKHLTLKFVLCIHFTTVHLSRSTIVAGCSFVEFNACWNWGLSRTRKLSFPP